MVEWTFYAEDYFIIHFFFSKKLFAAFQLFDLRNFFSINQIPEYSVFMTEY